jgi:hypothetical protein
MIFVNGQLVVDDGTCETAFTKLKDYLILNKLIVVDESNNPLNDEEILALIEKNTDECYVQAIDANQLLLDLCFELASYIEKIENYVERTRDEGNLSSVHEAFINVMEALIEFSKVQDYIQANVIDPTYLEKISLKALQQAQLGNDEYVLDLIEYEITPIFKDLLKLIEERI